MIMRMAYIYVHKKLLGFLIILLSVNAEETVHSTGLSNEQAEQH